MRKHRGAWLDALILLLFLLGLFMFALGAMAGRAPAMDIVR